MPERLFDYIFPEGPYPDIMCSIYLIVGSIFLGPFLSLVLPHKIGLISSILLLLLTLALVLRSIIHKKCPSPIIITLIAFFSGYLHYTYDKLNEFDVEELIEKTRSTFQSGDIFSAYCDGRKILAILALKNKTNFGTLRAANVLVNDIEGAMAEKDVLGPLVYKHDTVAYFDFNDVTSEKEMRRFLSTCCRWLRNVSGNVYLPKEFEEFISRMECQAIYMGSFSSKSKIASEMLIVVKSQHPESIIQLVQNVIRKRGGIVSNREIEYMNHSFMILPEQSIPPIYTISFPGFLILGLGISADDVQDFSRLILSSKEMPFSKPKQAFLKCCKETQGHFWLVMHPNIPPPIYIPIPILDNLLFKSINVKKLDIRVILQPEFYCKINARFAWPDSSLLDKHPELEGKEFFSLELSDIFELNMILPIKDKRKSLHADRNLMAIKNIFKVSKYQPMMDKYDVKEYKLTDEKDAIMINIRMDANQFSKWRLTQQQNWSSAMIAIALLEDDDFIDPQYLEIIDKICPLFYTGLKVYATIELGHMEFELKIAPEQWNEILRTIESAFDE